MRDCVSALRVRTYRWMSTSGLRPSMRPLMMIRSPIRAGVISAPNRERATARATEGKKEDKGYVYRTLFRSLN